MKYSKGFIQIIIPIILAVAIVVSLGYFALKNRQLKISSSPTAFPMKELKLAPCDLDANGKCDSADLVLFQQALGKSRGNSNYNPLADADADGVITDTDQQILFPTSSPPVKTEPYNTDVSSWKTYAHQNPMFEFKYPADWYDPDVVSNSSGEVIKFESRDNTFQLTVLTGLNKNMSYDESRKNLSLLKGGTLTDSEKYILYLGNMEHQAATYIDAYLLSKNNILIRLTLLSKNNDDQIKNIIDQILSTFKFKEAETSSNDIIEVTCPNMRSSELTFLQSYFNGDQCRFDTQSDCEKADVVSVNNGQISERWSQDGKPDCRWIEKNSKLNQCVPKYACKSSN